MITNDLLAAGVSEWNGTPDAASRAPRYQALVEETNRLVRESADATLTLDSPITSFQALKDSCRSGAEDA